MKLLFVGDVMLGRLVNGALKFQPAEYPWGDTLPIFRSADWRMCNLECVISDKGQPWSRAPKVFHFRSDAKNVAVLKSANINAVSLANNHTLDFDYEALFEMLKIMETAGIACAGAGRNISEAAEERIMNVKGLKIGLVAFTDNEPDWEAGENRPGIFYAPVDPGDRRAQKLLNIVAKTKKESDLAVVSAHWGPNWGYKPPAEQIPFAHALIDAGADIIFGHSGHIFRGIEIYKNRPIIYSAGDFIDDYAIDEIERNDESFIFVVEIKEKKVNSLRLYPTVIKNFQALAAQREQAKEIAEKMNKLCSGFSFILSPFRRKSLTNETEYGIMLELKIGEK